MQVQLDIALVQHFGKNRLSTDLFQYMGFNLTHVKYRRFHSSTTVAVALSKCVIDTIGFLP